MHSPSWFRPGKALAALRPMGQCLVCRSWDAEPLCGECVARFAHAVPRCRRCGLRTGTAASVCGDCLADPPPFDSCSVACDYAFPWDRLIGDFKFRGQVQLAAPLARLMVHAVRRDAEPPPQAVLPVPLAPQRLAERGFNQAWELARHAARALGCKAEPRGLDRPWPTAHQAELKLSQRIKNLSGAFVPAPSRRMPLQGRHLALVDDVMTSGATLREAAAALRHGGAARVDVWVLARTPAADD